MKFNYLKIKDVCDFVGGSQPPKSQFIYVSKPGYVRLIQTRDYKTDAFPTYIPISSTKKFCDEFDIMIGRYGPPIFQICRGLKGAYNVALLKVIPKEGVSRDFLYYFLKQDSVFQYVDKLSARTGGQTGVDLVSLKEYPVRIPEEIECQEKLVTILSVIDKKIALNNRINTELEAMAKTLYDYWFVQFDFPDANGKPYKTSGGKMEYNATLKREIPAGWNDSILGKFIELDRGVTYSKEDVRTQDDKDTIGILRATNVTGNNVDIDDLVFIPSSRVNVNQMLNKFDILIVMSSGSKERVGKNGVYYFEKKHAFGAFCSKITPVRKYRYFINTFLQSKWFKSYINNQCLGTNINNLTNTHITNCEIICPTPDVVALFENKMMPIYNKLASNTQENSHLIQLRDWLLPLLMNGQVTVK